MIWPHMLPCPSVFKFARNCKSTIREAKRQIKFQQQCMHGIKWRSNPQNLRSARLAIGYISQYLQNLDERFFTRGVYKANMLSKKLGVHVENLDDVLPYAVKCKFMSRTSVPGAQMCPFEHKLEYNLGKPDCAIRKVQLYGYLYKMMMSDSV